MTHDHDGRRQLILVAALPLGPWPKGQLRAKCCRVLRGVMGRAGLWTEEMRHACYGAPDLLNRTFTLWYDTLIEMTRPVPVRPLLLRDGGNLDLPAGAYFTSCHLTYAGRRAAAKILSARPAWRDEPAELT